MVSTDDLLFIIGALPAEHVEKKASSTRKTSPEKRSI
jgi:hypothetical protein